MTLCWLSGAYKSFKRGPWMVQVYYPELGLRSQHPTYGAYVKLDTAIRLVGKWPEWGQAGFRLVGFGVGVSYQPVDKLNRPVHDGPHGQQPPTTK